ncbi:hypothetical protein [Streptomyces alkaliterrae]|uniref:Uncharacterized protein n=1 Tax=Streptomyces alkaliterrae TaxID=2213162 RepID=A0A5P0YK75_9ACTN|nr:hypothetical protein [Streptomyces alkaliterrae]MBB1251843.1 hypothetical protein [Streptomyces alkaliterrae]MBB1259302.1 hypothetical protein [Streptomyces alkaliterrae]MQS00320.1 hypothetical protein [Streptomyces alkaliterrae]
MAERERISVDIDDLTIAEIETIEEVIDAPLDTMSRPDMKKGRFLRAIAVVVKRRTDPDFSVEDAGDLIISLSQDEKPDPTAAVA